MWAQRLTAGGLGGDTAGSSAGRAVRAVVARTDERTPELIRALRAADREDLGTAAAATPGGEVLVAALQDIARKTGSRALYGGPTGESDLAWLWDEVWRSLHGTSRTAVRDAGVATELAARLTTSKRWRTIRVLTGQIVDIRMRWIERQAREATASLAAREHAKATVLALGGEERRIIDEAARRLVASRQLRSTEAVMYLTDTEVTAMLLGASPPPRAELRRRRLVGAQNAIAGPLPPLFIGSPDQAPSAQVPDSAVLHGWAASPGLIEAPARVVSDLADAARLERGEILVAVATDPSWTPVLLVAGGIVLETGGPLSHGAIVARELGIPAVLNVPFATRVVADGERIQVDGFTGVAKRLEDVLVEAPT